ncbi:hypothetical protein [Anaerotignum propionicum]|uniref:hypothetical protein n=1 Tax=Anaerotignum propionicum TaxID=28446 RepID=UPI0028A29F11|nr:hypothetical protein [Anaerotignum propionicum]
MHYGSTTVNVLMEEGRGAACALNMETGLINDKLCVSPHPRVRQKFKLVLKVLKPTLGYGPV